MPVYKTPINLNDDSSNSIENRNLNFVNPSGFRLVIEDRKFRNIQYTVQSIKIPEITVEGAAFSLPTRNIKVVGSKIEYGLLDVGFIIDENFLNYMELHNWMISYIHEDDGPRKRKSRDISLIVLNSHNNPAREFKFADAFPTTLSAVSFAAGAELNDYLTATVSFAYSYFRIV